MPSLQLRKPGHLAVAILAAMFLPAAGAAVAQNPSPLARGDVLRVFRYSEPNTPIRVTFVAWSSDSLIGQREPGGDTLQVALQQVSRLEIRSGTRSRWLTGAGIGAGGGLLLGGLVGLVLMNQEFGNQDQYDARAIYPVAGAAIGAVVGGLTGALVGSGMKTDRWIRLNLNGPGFGLTVDRRGTVAVGLSWRM